MLLVWGKMYFNVQKKHQVFLTPLTEGLGCTVGVIRMQWNISSGGTQNLLWSQGEQGGVRKMHFPVEQELLRGREWGKLDCLLWASSPEEELPQQKGPQRGDPLGWLSPLGKEEGHTHGDVLYSAMGQGSVVELRVVFPSFGVKITPRCWRVTS